MEALPSKPAPYRVPVVVGRRGGVDIDASPALKAARVGLLLPPRSPTPYRVPVIVGRRGVAEDPDPGQGEGEMGDRGRMLGDVTPSCPAVAEGVAAEVDGAASALDSAPALRAVCADVRGIVRGIP